MPIPVPGNTEDRNTFVSRCMGAESMQEYEQDIRLGICYSQWRKKPKKLWECIKDLFASEQY